MHFLPVGVLLPFHFLPQLEYLLLEAFHLLVIPEQLPFIGLDVVLLLIMRIVL